MVKQYDSPGYDQSPKTMVDQRHGVPRESYKDGQTSLVLLVDEKQKHSVGMNSVPANTCRKFQLLQISYQ